MLLSFSATEMRQSSLRLEGSGVGFARPKNDNERAAMLKSFGWDGNNSNTYYPEINSGKEVIPQEEDFVQAPWRLLSAGIVAAYSWRATDFSKGNVLKRSVKLLNDVPLYKNHDTSSIDNWVGKVMSPTWGESYTDSKGNVIPAGINAILHIDAKTNPKVARGVLSNIINSNSVTVLFDWEPSHEFEDEYEFENNVGKVIDGKMVTRVATKIYDYYETSLVWLGADPYAKKIQEDGVLLKVDHTGVHQNPVENSKVPTFEQEPEAIKLAYTQNKTYSVYQRLSKQPLDISYINNDNNNEMEELLKALRVQLGLEENAEVTPEMVATLTKGQPVDNAHVSVFGKVTALAKEAAGEGSDINLDEFLANNVFVGKAEYTNSQEELTAKKAEVVTLTGDNATLVTEKETLSGELETANETITSLTSERDGLKTFAELGKTYEGHQRSEAIRLYKVVAGETADEAVVGLFEKATSEELTGLLKQYTKGATEKFSGKCASCGSEEFEFRSSLTVEGEEKEEKSTNSYEGDPDYLREKYSQRSMTL